MGNVAIGDRVVRIEDREVTAATVVTINGEAVLIVYDEGGEGYITHIGGSVRGAATNSITGDLYTREGGGVFRSRWPFSVINGGYLQDDFVIEVPEKTDIVVRAQAASGLTLDVSAHFEVLLKAA